MKDSRKNTLHFCVGALAAVAFACFPTLVLPAPMSGTGDLATVNSRPIKRHLCASLGLSANNIPAMAPIVADSGAGWVRLWEDWALIQPHADSAYNWSTLDAAVGAYNAQGVKVSYLVRGAPCWTAPDRSSCTQPGPPWQVPNEADWTKFVTSLATHFKGRIAAYSIWNEPNYLVEIAVPGIDTNQEADEEKRIAVYRDKILIPAAKAIRAADPLALIVAPEMDSGGGGATSQDFTHRIEIALGNGAAKLIDAVSVHIYPPNRDETTYGQAARAAMQTLGIAGKPLWLTEFGFAASGTKTGREVGDPVTSDTLAAQASFIMQNLTANSDSHMFQKMFLFNLKAHYGIINDDGSPRPAYQAIQRFTGVQGVSPINHCSVSPD